MVEAHQNKSVPIKLSSAFWGWVVLALIAYVFLVWAQSTMEISPSTETKVAPGMHPEPNAVSHDE